MLSTVSGATAGSSAGKANHKPEVAINTDSWGIRGAENGSNPWFSTGSDNGGVMIILGWGNMDGMAVDHRERASLIRIAQYFLFSSFTSSDI